MTISGQRVIKLYGIFGFPLEHTLSPWMHESAFRALGIKALYLPLKLDRVHFARVCRNLRRILLEGFNVTVPYKETILPYLDRLDKVSASMGAVNTVKRVGRRFYGYNTDVYGFLAALKERGRFNPRGKTALILGAGGAAKAVGYSLGECGAKKVVISNRHRERAVKMKNRLQIRFPSVRFEAIPMQKKSLANVLEECDLLVNATSVGLGGKDPVLIPSKILPKRNLLVFDLIYNPVETTLLRTARRKGLRTLNGAAMLFYQAVRAFELWTERKAPRQVMWKALMEAS